MEIVHTSGLINKLWFALILYAVGFGITAQSTWQESRLTGRLICTRLELEFNGITSLLYLLATVWLFTKLSIVYAWWESAILMLIAFSLGTVVTELLLRFFGILRGIVFLISMINLVWLGYILYTV